MSNQVNYTQSYLTPMKNTLGVVSAFVIGLVIGGGSVHFLTKTDTTSSSSPEKPSILTGILKGSDQYEIRWIGEKGTKMIGGSYAVAHIDGSQTPMRVETVNTLLPHTTKFSEPKGVIVSAGAGFTHGAKVEVRIFRNGQECGKVTTVGSGAINGKVCQ